MLSEKVLARESHHIKCESCGQKFEENMSGKRILTCPHCGCTDLSKFWVEIWPDPEDEK